MWKRLIYLVFFIAISNSMDAQVNSIRKDAEREINKWNKNHNLQMLDLWLNRKIPIRIRLNARITDPGTGERELNESMLKLFSKEKLTILNLGGSSVEMTAFDPEHPEKSKLTDKDLTPFNYFKKNGVYFKIINSKSQDVTRSSFNILADPVRKRQIYEQQSHVAATAISVNNYLAISFYDKNNDTLIRTFFIKRIKAVPFIQQALAIGKSSKIHRSLPLNNSKFFHLSKDETATLKFRRYEDQKDAVIQYQLTSAGRANTPWLTTAHELTIGNLAPNTNYQLKLRYSFQQESSVVYHIKTSPRWFQTATFITIIIIALGVLTVFSMLRFADSRIKRSGQKHLQLQQEIRSIQNQLNPHFIFNAMGSIQGLINTNQVNSANEYLSEFSKLLRATLNNSHLIYLPLFKEAEILENYLKLEQLRFGFQYEITICSTINSKEVDVPNFLLQPLVENAVKHGVSALTTTGLIRVRFERDNTDMKVSIIDNGPGSNHNVLSEGYGIKFTKEKITLLNSLLKYEGITLSLKNEEGTVAEIKFNNWLS